jgi:peptidoglycan/LPS O-acetylase OafA/YrhL
MLPSKDELNMNEAGTPTSVPRGGGQASRSEEPHVLGSEPNIPLGYLRAIIIVLVLVHHTTVAYLLPVAPPPASSLVEYLHSIRAISPVIDVVHSRLFFFVIFFNDRFLMPLMFFLSGLFVWGSLQRKGRLVFFRDRMIRLGIPFIVMVILAPITYYTSYLQTRSSAGPLSFWQQWMSLGDWPTGPAWFLWLLLAFDIVVIALSLLTRGRSDFPDKIPSAVMGRPGTFFWLLVVISAVSYIPMTALYDPYFSWWRWGPFSFQTARVFLYLVYFLVGVTLGMYGTRRTFLAPSSILARRWYIWVAAALAAFLANIVSTLARANETLVAVSLLLFCAAACFAFLAIFLKFAVNPSRVLDSLFRNSYGIYVIHYVVVSWVLYAILKTTLPAIAKGSIVFLCSLAFCWGTISLIRRVPSVARVI